ncbi:hypothetical protein THAOC_37236 [Thalassiosira oceanica]|uniref:MYND-type domain-containing protein n=1 Tax=Thalassiosira oceanica TaxID=159749 RepID=K0QZ25_THAOC|nr:hypothetical protein THAOC_37236 [Thalassiosira oceanica]|eukprot:EJK44245.1 hypothetical protein THAOC_37236 [Thalassiosira oceanica]
MWPIWPLSASAREPHLSGGRISNLKKRISNLLFDSSASSLSNSTIEDLFVDEKAIGRTGITKRYRSENKRSNCHFGGRNFSSDLQYFCAAVATAPPFTSVDIFPPDPATSSPSLAVHRGRPQALALSDHLTPPDQSPQRPESRRAEPPCNCTPANPNLMMMRCVPCEGDGDESCANCGKLGSDDVKLKNCTACRLVKYCGVDCQRAHRKKHKKACKQRVAELKDEQLYSQGLERPEGDFCPICTLPIPLPTDVHSVFMGLGLQKDMRKAVELWTEAAELGSIDALFNLGLSYFHGEGVQQDNAKAADFWTKAAMQGHAESRYNLGSLEGRKGNHDRAVRHWLISAKMGDERSLETIKEAFKAGAATKEQYAEALKRYQDAVEEMKSHDRDEDKGIHG